MLKRILNERKCQNLLNFVTFEKSSGKINVFKNCSSGIEAGDFHNISLIFFFFFFEEAGLVWGTFSYKTFLIIKTRIHFCVYNILGCQDNAVLIFHFRIMIYLRVVWKRKKSCEKIKDCERKINNCSICQQCIGMCWYQAKSCTRAQCQKPYCQINFNNKNFNIATNYYPFEK